MGLFALVDYSLIRELCDKIKKDKKVFTGRVKEELDDEGASTKDEKINEVRRLLLSGKRKTEKEQKKGKRKRKGKSPEPRFTQYPTSESESSDTGSSTGSGSTNTSENDFDANPAGKTGNDTDARSNSK